MLFASRMQENMCFHRFLSIGRARSLMLTFEPPIKSGCLWVAQRRVMASFSILVVVFIEAMTKPSRCVGDSFGWNRSVEMRLLVERLSWILLMDAGSCWCGKVRLCSCLKEGKISAASSPCVAISSSLLGKMMEGSRPLMMKAGCSLLLLTGGSWKWQWLMLAVWFVVCRLVLMRKSWKSVPP